MIFNRFTHNCVVVDVLADVWVEEIITAWVKVFFEINLWVSLTIDKLCDM